MQLTFSYPSRQSRVRFFRNSDEFREAVRAKGGAVIWDSGAPYLVSGAYLLPGGEKVKRWPQAGKLLDFLAKKNHERNQPVLVVGGGAVLDLGAFASSLYRRGTPLILAPSTLLGMVDAAVGGKTAVDSFGAGGLKKNFAGTFYPADEVWVCPDFLSTLPRRERVSGAGECWKTIWIAGIRGRQKALLDYVQNGKISPALRTLLKRCLAAKISVVKRDPLDQKRIREVLNFGHTAGHVLESLSKLSHGEAVLWGMAIETCLLGARGRVMQAELALAIGAMDLRLPARLRSVSEKEILALLLADKKVRGGKIELSLLRKPGSVVRMKISPAGFAKKIKVFLESVPL